MSEYDDYEDDWYENRTRNTQQEIDENAESGYWETADGDQIPFEELTEHHVRNILLWCASFDIEPPKELSTAGFKGMTGV
ncbi:MAG: hypothetical protein V3U75_13465 [Methylococcaceae bacterium]